MTKQSANKNISPQLLRSQRDKNILGWSIPDCNAACKTFSGVLEYHAHPPKDSHGSTSGLMLHYRLTSKFEAMYQRIKKIMQDGARTRRNFLSGKGGEFADIDRRSKAFNKRFSEVVNFVWPKTNGEPPYLRFPVGFLDQKDRRAFESFIFQLSPGPLFQGRGGQKLKADPHAVIEAARQRFSTSRSETDAIGEASKTFGIGRSTAQRYKKNFWVFVPASG